MNPVEAKARATAALREAQQRLPKPGHYALAGTLFGLSLPGAALLASPVAVVTALLAAAYWLLLARRTRVIRREIAVLEFERRRADDELKQMEKRSR